MGQLRQRGGIWQIRYYRGGRLYEETSRSDKKGVAQALLRTREGDIAKGVPVTSKIGRLRFDEAAADVVNDYRVNDKRSLGSTERRIRLHLTPYFGGRLMASITTAHVRAYVAHRQAQTEIIRSAYKLRLKDGTTRHVAESRRPVERISNAEINRELALLKRAFNLAVQAGKLLHKPHVPLLREHNTRTGFFESEMFASVLQHLPTSLQPVIEFAYVTGWRVVSEVLPLEWRHVDFHAGEVRLDVGTTKNGEGRVFPMTNDLRRVLELQHSEHLTRKKAGQIVPWVFVRMVADGRGGPKTPRRIVSIGKAWASACVDAGCPGRIPHDLRRTAVRNMVRRGVPERVAMKLTGHKTRSIFDRYNIVSDGDLKTAATQLSDLSSFAAWTKHGQFMDSAPVAPTKTAKLLRKSGGAARN